MKAVLWTAYGSTDVLQLAEVAKPIPKDNEVLIKIHAATVNAGDCEMRSFKIQPMLWLPVRLMVGIFKPRIKTLGQELAGEIEAVGKEVKRFKVGDQIFGASEMKLGTHAEYICLPSNYPIAQKPSNMNFEEAATLTVGGLNALVFLRKAKIQKGEKVLINGAGGSIGTFAVQMIKSLGAEVTVVDSAEKLDMLHSIGADYSIDYRTEDFTKNGKQYDVVFDVFGKEFSSAIINSLQPKGRYLIVNLGLTGLLRGGWTNWTSDKKVITGVVDYKIEDLEYLKEQIEAGQLKTVIDKKYPLEKIKEAHQYVEAGHKKGNFVITMNH